MKLVSAAAALGLAATAAIGLAGSASADGHRPDTACQQAGMKTLREAGLMSSVARDGLPIATAVSVGVKVRPGADISDVPNPIPLKVVLADHRAGKNSLFLYPWC